MLATDNIFPITVNWNLAADTIDCVASLMAAGVSPEHIIVVDNASTDGSVSALRAALAPGVHILTSDTNRGYAAGVNIGAQRALEQGAEWLFVLNNDTEVSASFFRALEQAARQSQRDSILAPLILYMRDRDRIWRCGDRIIPGTLLTRSLYRNQCVTASIPTIVPVDFVTGCGMLIPRRLFETVGPLDESLFMYGEEVDYCWRARLAGFSLACVTSARMWHKVSASSNRDRPRARLLQVQNQSRFYRTYARGWQWPLMLGLSAMRALTRLLLDVAAGQWDLIRPTISGWWHGWMCSTIAA